MWQAWLCLERACKQDQRSGLILVSPLGSASPDRFDERQSQDERKQNPAGTCWEGGERESGSQEVPTEIANTTTRLICFFGQRGGSKGDKTFGLAGQARCACIRHCIRSPPLSLASLLLLLCFTSPALEFQQGLRLCWSGTHQWELLLPCKELGHLDSQFHSSVCSTAQGLLLEDIFEPQET